MRLAWYAGASAALAGAVVASAFHQRANFYSAMVHLAQSSLSLMILVNLMFLVYGSFVYGLQRLCFGQLRPAEIEQLYEKAWFAVTETCLAMTIFREEVGAFFLVMFTALVTGKVWGWIGDGRVEVLEQQPPANPRLFHTRLSISLLFSCAYNVLLLKYAVDTVVQQARPTMMVMFLFEFAVQTVISFHTLCRYIISLVDARVTKLQTAQRLEERRRQVREQRAEILRRRETEGVTETESEAAEALPSEDEIDEMDIEVSGWESKGQWVLALDLLADFIKMGIYATFFCVLFTFYGLPIHIMRDVFMTTRSFIKRLNALLRYRQALRDMNKYPDATAEELGREDTCIICREEMHPWDTANPGQVERSRPKKLPCGHILHFGCLKSWLERQQMCPTCRRPVVMDAPPARGRNGDGMVFRFGLNLPGRNPGQQPPPIGVAGAAQGGPAPQGGQNGVQNDQQGRNGRVRMFNFGPVRIGFAQGDEGAIRNMAQQMGLPADGQNPPTAQGQAPAQYQNTDGLLAGIRDQLTDVMQRVAIARQRIHQDVQQVQNAEAQIGLMNMLLDEMARLNRIGTAIQQQPHPAQQNGAVPGAAQPQEGPQTQGPAQGQFQPQPQHPQQPQAFRPLFPGFAQAGLPGQQGLPGHYAQFPQVNHLVPRVHTPTVTRHGGPAHSVAIPAGSPDLPAGVVIPEGWSLLPLQRLEGPPSHQVPGAGAFQPQVNPQGPLPPPGELYHQLMALNGNQIPNTAAAPPPNVSGAENGSHITSAPSHPLEQEQRGRSPPAPPSHPVEQSAQVTAPTPVLPNWGGPAQLFGAGGIGARDTAASTPATEQTHFESIGGENGEGSTGRGKAWEANGQTAEDTGGAGEDKGKARAVTVEDDESEGENDT